MAKSATRTTNPRAGAADRSTRAPAPPSATVEESDIARLAFERYGQRGGHHGHDVDDWLQAERELRGALKPAAES
jgi:hypothetical protein